MAGLESISRMFGRRHRIRLTFASVALAILAAAFWQAWADFRRVEDEAARRLGIAADTAATYAAQVFGSAKLALAAIDMDSTAPELVLHLSSREAAAILQRAQLSLPAIRAFALIGADGRVAVSAVPDAPPIDLSDRAFFVAHRDKPSTDMRIDPPVVARPSGVVSITVSMRIEQPAGGFGGVVAALLDPHHFSAFFAKLGVDTVGMTDVAGNLFARHPATDLIAAELRPANAVLPRDRAQYMTSMRTGQTRLGFRASVPGTQLVVYSSLPRIEIVMAWLPRLATVLAAALLSIVLLAWFTTVWSGRVRQAERLIEERATGEREARREANQFREVARSKSDFLAHMGHELRTPLNAIIGFSEVISTDAMKLGGPARYREYAADIRFSADHLLGVIDRILDLSKIEAGRWVLSPGPVESRNLVGTVVHLARERAAREGVTLDTSGTAAGIEFTGDERVLVQMLLNLVINAIKFAGEDRIVRIACRRRDGGTVEFRVADRGRGMTPADAARALRPFEVAADPEARKKSDTGLGLPLARMFAELHGGALTIDTAPGAGTTVLVRLPAGGPAEKRA